MKRGNAGIAVITGSGMEGRFNLAGRRVVKTRYGSSITYTSRVGGRAFYVLPRHGVEHDVPPHRINYRANIAALSQLGVKTVIATTAVGSMKPEFGVGQLGLLEQFIDFTKGRSSTFLRLFIGPLPSILQFSVPSPRLRARPTESELPSLPVVPT